MDMHATAEDLAEWMGEPDPRPDAVRYLRPASLLVDRAARYSRFNPASPTVIEALRDATCAAASYWIANKIEPMAQGVTPSGSGAMASATILSGSVTVAGAEQQAAARVAASTALCDEAVLILEGAGLTGRLPWVIG